MSIEGLTSDLAVLKQHGEPDLQFSERARDDYIRLISDYRTLFIEQLKRVVPAANLGYAGEYSAVNQTKMRLETNASGDDGIRGALDKFIEYLNVLEDTVNAAFERVHAEDQS